MPVIPGQFGTGSKLLNIPKTMKNSTKGREYMMRECPGNFRMRHTILADPFVALLLCMCVPGDREGLLDCDSSEKNMIFTAKTWTVHGFTYFMRERQHMCGVGPGSVTLYSDVNLYRSIGIRDKQIMAIIQVIGINACATLQAAYNNCDPKDLPRFSNVRDFLENTAALVAEAGVTVEGAYKNS